MPTLRSELVFILIERGKSCACRRCNIRRGNTNKCHANDCPAPRVAWPPPRCRDMCAEYAKKQAAEKAAAAKAKAEAEGMGGGTKVVLVRLSITKQCHDD